MSKGQECPLHKYSEQSARAKLARHRKKGERWSMFFHPVCGQWHCHPSDPKSPDDFR